MKRIYQIEGTDIKRTSKTHDYTHAVVRIVDGKMYAVAMCGSHALAERAIKEQRRWYPNTKCEIRKAIRIN